MDNMRRPVVDNDPEYLRQSFFFTLLQSTLSLADVVDIADQVLDDSQSRLNLPSREALSPLRDCIITWDTLNGLIRNANPRRHTIDFLVNARTEHQGPKTFQSGPTFFVPALPWTHITDDDVAVSHLVSLFLAFLNPFYRFVEEDLFLQGMRSKNRQSEFCSCLLVNTILSAASVNIGPRLVYVDGFRNR